MAVHTCASKNLQNQGNGHDEGKITLKPIQKTAIKMLSILCHQMNHIKQSGIISQPLLLVNNEEALLCELGSPKPL